MSKNKLAKFKELSLLSNTIQPNQKEILTNSFPLKGKWNQEFKNNNPIVLELGCGKGEYTVNLAEINPEVNYIGIDIKGARIWKGATLAHKNKLDNVRFLRTQIEQLDKFSPLWKEYEQINSNIHTWIGSAEDQMENEGNLDLLYSELLAFKPILSITFNNTHGQQN